ncbi:ExeM/NucH family extracellular endonuclease [Vibrio atypicus]|uniref:ExeM/NucH family extracellular endonuclease n=1 Tax=Vibrio atypicus TaxID=558271 RepID=UPI001356C853|nr:ExeM/NucH family extracellular endonuclease [Vibrio atypicus]
MNKKMTLLAGAISTVLSGVVAADIGDMSKVLITEYVEGSSQNKAIEISNTGTSAVTFEGNDGDLALYFSRYKNMVHDKDKVNVLKNVTIAPGKSIVVVNGEAGAEIFQYIERLGGEGAVVTAGTYDQAKYNALTFNGDDAVWLGTSSAQSDVHDIFGIYSDSDAADDPWANMTLRRKAGSGPKNTYDVNDWEEFAQNDFGGLGDPVAVNNDPIAPPANTPCTDATDSEEQTIGAVQGEGKFSPLITEGYETTEQYKVTGIVSAVTSYPAKGFYLYDNDGNDLTSDGIFVPTAQATDSMVGQKVCVVAKVKENYGLTQLVVADDKWEVVDENPVSVEPVELKRHADDTTFESTLERYEGMLVKTSADMGKTDQELAAIDALVEQVTVEPIDGEDEADYQVRLAAAKEARRDELTAVKHDMRVSRSFSFDYDAFRNNMVLAYKRPNPQPNQDHVAGSIDSLTQSAENDDFRLILESDGKAPNGEIPYYPEFRQDPQNNYVRINDSVVGLTGVIGYSYGNFNIIVPKALESSQNTTFVHNTDRTDEPTINESYGDHGFTIKVATQNVLNYFNSPYGGSDNSFGDNRGAESQQEFERQQAKIVEAIYGLDADILGVMEVENNGFGDFSAINELLAAVNDKYYDEDYGDRNKQNSIHNRYVFVGFDKNGDAVLDDQDTVGSDAITTGVIYRPSKVSIVTGEVIPMPEQHAPTIVDENGAPILDSKGEIRESGDNYQRHSVVATFKVNHTGKKLSVAVNHFKSKGSTCYEDWKGWETWKNFDPVKDDVRNDDFQGSCENFRVAAAYHLGSELEDIVGDKVVLGDMNSYAHEDPMLVLTNNSTGKAIYASEYTFVGKTPFEKNGQRIEKTFGYLNAVDLKTEEGKTSWSYSYNDEVGSLDHMLISSSLKNRLVDATDWHINAPESSLYDYNNKYKGGDENEPNPFYAENPFRSSDHDSAIISLGYTYGEAGEVPVSITMKSGRADIAFPVSDQAREGDVAEISISPRPAGVTLPKVALKADGAQTVMFDVAGLEAGEYTLTMVLKGDRDNTQRSTSTTEQKVIDSKTMPVSIEKRDSSNVKPVEPEYDGSGGSFGLGTLLAMFGFGFLRRRR